MRIFELLQVFVTVFQDPVWIPPAVLMVLGLVGGGAMAVWLTRRSDHGEVDAERDRLDLEKRREAVIEAVRALDLERDKLSPEDYEREKRALIGHGAAAMRALEEPLQDQTRHEALVAAIEAEKESLGEDRVAAITALLHGEALPKAAPAATEPASGLRPEVKGALWVGGGMIALLLLFLGLTAYEAGVRRDAAPPVAAARPGAPPAAPAQAPLTPEEQGWLDTLEGEPTNLEALNGLTDSEIRRQNWEQAGAYNGRALAAAPTDSEARVWKALLMYREGNYPQAVAELDSVIADAPDFPRAHQFRGMIHMQMRELDQALSRFERALELTEDPRAKAGIRQLISETRQTRAASAPELAGTIRLADGLDPASFGEGAQLFVSVKAASGPPMPLRAKRVEMGTFPVSFELTGLDAPMRGGPLPETVTLVVKVDLDGNPMGDDPGAPKVQIEGVTPGSLDLDVVLGP